MDERDMADLEIQGWEEDRSREEEKDKVADLMVKVVGVSHKNLDGSSRQEILAEIFKAEGVFSITLVREPENEYDSNAIMVFANGKQVGYIGKDEATLLSPLMDAGVRFEAEVFDFDHYLNEKEKKDIYFLHILVREV